MFQNKKNYRFNLHLNDLMHRVHLSFLFTNIFPCYTVPPQRWTVDVQLGGIGVVDLHQSSMYVHGKIAEKTKDRKGGVSRWTFGRWWRPTQKLLTVFGNVHI